MENDLSTEIKLGLKKEILDRSITSAIGQILLLATFYFTNKSEVDSNLIIIPLIISLLLVNFYRILYIVFYRPKPKLQYNFFHDTAIILSTALWGLLVIIVSKDIGFNSFSGMMIYIIASGVTAASTTSVAAESYLLNSFLVLNLAFPGFFYIIYYRPLQLKMMGIIFLIYCLFLKIQGTINRNNIISKIKINSILIEEKKHIENILNAIPGKIVYYDEKNNPIYANEEWKLHPLSNIHFFHFLDHFKNEPLNQKTYEIEINSYQHYLMNIQQIKDKQSKLIHFLDISEKKKAEEELEIQKVQLINSSRLAELGEMAGSIAHEINNPLTILNGKIRIANKHLMENTFDIEKLKQDISAIESVSDRISKIVKGMKSVMRNSEDDHYSTEMLSNIINDTIVLCEHKFCSSAVEFKYECEDHNIKIQCKPSQISQVIFNLLSNAIDAVESLEKKSVLLNITSNEQFVYIRVTDSGKGIPEEIKNKIFNPFFTTKEIGKGTGLGLSIGHKIITSHGGKIEIDDKNQHTSFLITLPKVTD